MLFYRGTFVASCGYLRAGKTMNMVRMAKEHHDAGWNVVANVQLTFGERVRSVEHLQELNNCVLCIDEAMWLFDSRSFAANVDLTQWLTLLGKRNIILLYTVQSFGMVDKRLRELTPIVFNCMRVNNARQGASVVQMCDHDANTASLRPRGKMVLLHRHYWDLYDTYAEDFIIKSENPSAREAKRGGRAERPQAGAPEPMRDISSSFF
jgi:hypothetical protein